MSAGVSSSSSGRRQGIVAAPHGDAVEAGEKAYTAGGNALDAAVAAAATLCVVYPHMTALGGDAVCLVRNPDGLVQAIDATGPAPAAVDAALLRSRHGARLPQRGADTITVPGGVAAWQQIHAAGARLPWADLLDRPITLAESGVAVAPSVARITAAMGEDLRTGSALADLMAPRGTPLQAGETLRQEALARSLREIAEKGAGALYGGRVGEELADGLRSVGAALALDDLRDYRPDVLPPLVETFGACSVHTSPPSTPGFVLLRVLRALSEAGIDPADALGRSLGVTVEAIVDGNVLCETALADRAAMTASVEDLIAGDVPKGVAPVRTGPLRPRGDTIGVAAMDDDGWAVAIVQSIFSGFGSAVLEPTTGILMHNRGSLFSLDPGSPNVIAPGKRPRHTLMPVMTTDHDGTLRFVAASMGGPNQPQIHAQVLLRLLAGSTYAEAVRAPRWLIGPRTPSDPPNAVYIEEDVAGEARSTLAAHDLAEVVMPAAGDGGGHMNVVGRDPDGALSGAADVRSDGRTAVVDLVS